MATLVITGQALESVISILILVVFIGSIRKILLQNGKPSLKGFYHSNLKDSVWQVYYENGNPQLEVLYRKGLRIKILNAYDLEGKQIVKDGNGQMINYFNSLKIQSQGNLEDGVEQGLWTFYYENGSKII